MTNNFSIRIISSKQGMGALTSLNSNIQCKRTGTVLNHTIGLLIAVNVEIATFSEIGMKLSKSALLTL